MKKHKSKKTVPESRDSKTVKREMNPASLANLEPTKFKPGVSGNPGGVPAGPKFGTRFAFYAQKPAQEVSPLLALATTSPHKLVDVPWIDVMVLRAMAAYHNDTNGAIFNAIFDRAEGKVAQSFDFTKISDDDVVSRLQQIAASGASGSESTDS